MAVVDTHSRSPYFGWQYLLPNVIHYWYVLKRTKWLILGVTLIFALVGFATAVTTPNVYQATVVVRPADNSSRGGNLRQRFRDINLLSGLGGGLIESLVSTHSIKEREALLTLKSRKFLTHFVEAHQLQRKPNKFFDSEPDVSDTDPERDIPAFQATLKKLQETHKKFREFLDHKTVELQRMLYKPHNFDSQARRGTSNGLGDDADGLREKIKHATGKPRGKIKRASRELRGKIEIERKTRQGVIHVKVRGGNPTVLAELANALIAGLNNYLRETAITEARERIAYLDRELDKTNIIPLRQSIYRLIEAETHTIMIAETRNDYALKIFEPAVPPSTENPIRPRRGRLVWTTAFMGFAIASFAVIFLDFVRMVRRQSEVHPAAP